MVSVVGAKPKAAASAPLNVGVTTRVASPVSLMVSVALTVLPTLAVPTLMALPGAGVEL
jgi:hypothetical protein